MMIPLLAVLLLIPDTALSQNVKPEKEIAKITTRSGTLVEITETEDSSHGRKVPLLNITVTPPKQEPIRRVAENYTHIFHLESNFGRNGVPALPAGIVEKVRDRIVDRDQRAVVYDLRKNEDVKTVLRNTKASLERALSNRKHFAEDVESKKDQPDRARHSATQVQLWEVRIEHRRKEVEELEALLKNPSPVHTVPAPRSTTPSVSSSATGKHKKKSASDHHEE